MSRQPASVFRFALFAALFAICAAPAAALDLGGHDRDGVVIGVNLGAGWHEVDAQLDGSSIRTDFNSAFSGGLRVGWARSDHLVGSLGIYGWKESYYQNLVPFSVTDFHFLAELSWYPRGEGFWIKGGVGGGTFDITITRPAAKETYKEGGWNYTIGAGYELRVSDETAVGIAYDLRYLDAGDFEPFAAVSTLSHNVSLNLAFYM